ncbi:M28 family metallopeptidase [Nocardioides cheoyonin]|uniref:M28 family metallopeptidase n=1 Tax=Nocardioides cheoyonin TaxID=3156615 RepID=UPI0032B52C82
MAPLRVLLAGLVLLAGCGGGTSRPAPGPLPSPPPTSASVSSAPAPSAAGPSAPSRRPRADPDDVRVRTAVAAVRALAGGIGPRPGTSAAYARAADWVEERFADLGWEVRRQPFRTPGGVSWGVPVPAGRSVNLVADRGDVRRGRPWLLVGAHLDTVPQSPGAEDDGSGIGVLLAVAEALRDRRTRLPVVLVAFGSEEPRGPSDADHHYGSRAYVAGLSPTQRRTLRGMVALDRVGVGAAVPACAATTGPEPTLSSLVRAARRAGVPTTQCSVVPNRSADHWSFAEVGLPAARLGGTSYAGYHSPTDMPSVVSAAQLRRTSRLVVEWLR